MREVPLLCSVRDCRQPLRPGERVYACPRGHSFDLARSGYLNLLQPQDKKSDEPGDSRESVQARERLFAKGIGAGLLMDLTTLAASLGEEPLVLDVGCGPGFLLTAIGEEGCGVDLSVYALERAAKRDPGPMWVAANADRFLPFPDATFDLLFSVTGPCNAPEFRRVLKPEGHLIVVVPAPDDLIELREAVLGRGDLVERPPRPLDMFQFVKRETSREKLRIEPDGLKDLLLATYRGARHSAQPRVKALERMDVTLASEIHVYM